MCRYVSVCVCVRQRKEIMIPFHFRIVLDGDTLEKLRETDKILVGNRHRSRQKVIVSVVHNVHRPLLYTQLVQNL